MECKVLFLSGGLQLSGSTTWMNSLISAFQNAGIPTVHLVTSIDTGVKSAAKKIHYTGRARKHLPIRILRLLQCHKIFTEYYARQEEQFFNKYVQQLLVNSKNKILVIKDFNSYLPDFFKSEQFVVVDVMHNHFTTYQPGYYRDCLIAVSQTVMKAANRIGFNVNNFIYNPLDVQSIASMSMEYEVEENNYILYVGRLSKDKGVTHLLESYSELLKENKINQKLVYLGSGSEFEFLSQYVEKNNLSGQVVFKGFVSNPYPYIKKAKLLVLPSYSEAMPYVIFEAAVLKTSYLVSNFLGYQEFFPDENVFEISDDTNIFKKNLKNKMLRLLDVPAYSLRDGLEKKVRPGKVAYAYYKLLCENKA